MKVTGLTIKDKDMESKSTNLEIVMKDSGMLMSAQEKGYFSKDQIDIRVFGKMINVTEKDTNIKKVISWKECGWMMISYKEE